MSVRELLRAVVRLPLRLIREGTVLRIRSGPLRGRKWIAGSAPHGSWLGTYEARVQKLFCNHIHAGDIVYDIGANAGFFTLLAATLVGPEGHVYAFEPLPRNIRYLEQHLLLNGVTNVTILPVAVAGRSGSARFRIASHASMGQLTEQGDLEIETLSLDDLIASGEARPPSFIKMDIEGAESEALRGARALLDSPALTLVLSTHGYLHHENCCAALLGAQFRLEQLRDGTDDGDYLVLATKA